METTASVRIAKESGTWAVSIDLCNVYLYMPIKQDPESFSTLWWMEKSSSSSGNSEFPRSPGFHKFDGNCVILYKKAKSNTNPVFQRLPKTQTVKGGTTNIHVPWYSLEVNYQTGSYPKHR